MADEEPGEESRGLSESLQSLRRLGRDLADLPDALRQATAQAAAIQALDARYARWHLRRRALRGGTAWILLICIAAAPGVLITLRLG